MQYTDEQIQKMLELKESIIDKMAKHQGTRFSAEESGHTRCSFERFQFY